MSCTIQYNERKEIKGVLTLDGKDSPLFSEILGMPFILSIQEAVDFYAKISSTLGIVEETANLVTFTFINNGKDVTMSEIIQNDLSFELEIHRNNFPSVVFGEKMVSPTLDSRQEVRDLAGLIKDGILTQRMYTPTEQPLNAFFNISDSLTDSQLNRLALFVNTYGGNSNFYAKIYPTSGDFASIVRTQPMGSSVETSPTVDSSVMEGPQVQTGLERVINSLINHYHNNSNSGNGINFGVLLSLEKIKYAFSLNNLGGVLSGVYATIRSISYSRHPNEVDLHEVTKQTNSFVTEVREQGGWHYRLGRKGTGDKNAKSLRMSLNVHGDPKLIEALDRLVDEFGIHYKTPDLGDNWSDRSDPITIYIKDSEMVGAKLEAFKQRVVLETKPYIRDNKGFGLYGDNISTGVEFGEEATVENANSLVEQVERLLPGSRQKTIDYLTSREGKFKGSVGQQMAVQKLIKELITGVSVFENIFPEKSIPQGVVQASIELDKFLAYDTVDKVLTEGVKKRIQGIVNGMSLEDLNYFNDNIDNNIITKLREDNSLRPNFDYIIESINNAIANKGMSNNLDGQTETEVEEVEEEVISSQEALPPSLIDITTEEVSSEQLEQAREFLKSLSLSQVLDLQEKFNQQVPSMRDNLSGVSVVNFYNNVETINKLFASVVYDLGLTENTLSTIDNSIVPTETTTIINDAEMVDDEGLYISNEEEVSENAIIDPQTGEPLRVNDIYDAVQNEMKDPISREIEDKIIEKSEQGHKDLVNTLINSYTQVFRQNLTNAYNKAIADIRILISQDSLAVASIKEKLALLYKDRDAENGYYGIEKEIEDLERDLENALIEQDKQIEKWNENIEELERLKDDSQHIEDIALLHATAYAYRTADEMFSEILGEDVFYQVVPSRIQGREDSKAFLEKMLAREFNTKSLDRNKEAEIDELTKQMRALTKKFLGARNDDDDDNNDEVSANNEGPSKTTNTTNTDNDGSSPSSNNDDSSIDFVGGVDTDIDTDIDIDTTFGIEGNPTLLNLPAWSNEDNTESLEDRKKSREKIRGFINSITDLLQDVKSSKDSAQLLSLIQSALSTLSSKEINYLFNFYTSPKIKKLIFSTANPYQLNTYVNMVLMLQSSASVKKDVSDIIEKNNTLNNSSSPTVETTKEEMNDTEIDSIIAEINQLKETIVENNRRRGNRNRHLSEKGKSIVRLNETRANKVLRIEEMQLALELLRIEKEKARVNEINDELASLDNDISDLNYQLNEQLDAEKADTEISLEDERQRIAYSKLNDVISKKIEENSKQITLTKKVINESSSEVEVTKSKKELSELKVTELKLKSEQEEASKIEKARVSQLVSNAVARSEARNAKINKKYEDSKDKKSTRSKNKSWKQAKSSELTESLKDLEAEKILMSKEKEAVEKRIARQELITQRKVLAIQEQQEIEKEKARVNEINDELASLDNDISVKEDDTYKPLPEKEKNVYNDFISSIFDYLSTNDSSNTGLLERLGAKKLQQEIDYYEQMLQEQKELDTYTTQRDLAEKEAVESEAEFVQKMGEENEQAKSFFDNEANQPLIEVINDTVTQEEQNEIAEEESVPLEEVVELIGTSVQNSVGNVSFFKKLGNKLREAVLKVLKSFITRGAIFSGVVLSTISASSNSESVKNDSKAITASIERITYDSSFNSLTEDGKEAYKREKSLNKPFLILDKPTARLYGYDASGKLFMSIPAILGAAKGDGENYANTNVGENEKFEKATTTAGRFLLRNTADYNLKSYHGNIFDIAGTKELALHKYYYGELKKRKAAAETSTIDDNRMSWGCPNVSPESFKVMRDNGIGQGTVISITRDFQGPANIQNSKRSEEALGVKYTVAEKREILKEKGLKDNTEYTAEEILKTLEIKGAEKEVYNSVKSLINKLGIKIKFSSTALSGEDVGSFNPVTGEIIISPIVLRGTDASSVILHEVVHALTTKIITKVNSGKTEGLTDKQINAVVGLMELYSSVKSDPNFDNKYALSNVYEFIAHLSNHEFSKQLEKKDTSFIQKVIGFISDILGITNSKDLAHKYLKDIMSNGEYLQDTSIKLLRSEVLSKEEVRLQFLEEKLKDLQAKKATETQDSNPKTNETLVEEKPTETETETETETKEVKDTEEIKKLKEELKENEDLLSRDEESKKDLKDSIKIEETTPTENEASVQLNTIEEKNKLLIQEVNKIAELLKSIKSSKVAKESIAPIINRIVNEIVKRSGITTEEFLSMVSIAVVNNAPTTREAQKKVVEDLFNLGNDNVLNNQPSEVKKGKKPVNDSVEQHQNSIDKLQEKLTQIENDELSITKNYVGLTLLLNPKAVGRNTEANAIVKQAISTFKGIKNATNVDLIKTIDSVIDKFKAGYISKKGDIVPLLGKESKDDFKQVRNYLQARITGETTLNFGQTTKGIDVKNTQKQINHHKERIAWLEQSQGKNTEDNNTPSTEKKSGVLLKYQTGESVILLDEKLADPSTVLHEFVHIFEEYLTPQEVKILEQWSGFKKGTTEFSEAFAVGAEKFVFESEVTTKIDPIFDKFIKWFKRKVNEFTDKLNTVPSLNEEVKNLYKSILVKEVLESKIDTSTLSENDKIKNNMKKIIEDVVAKDLNSRSEC